ncbi:aromatic ring-opening dioxygenase LigA [Cupriavidus sp. SHE]|jgi:2,3-dihydroxybiphenyl 1,2-dioxygenase|uniref:2,3-dihydroxybiphenyl 1,2-dioxygenase n=1 Tax=Cupriavidus metallidurans TaxID=119219 RepID=A0A482IY25_9BURK|nr:MULTISPECIES: VOC family protein [Cupriavidus]KWR87011.1 aromatic ring-opening dioxygenase LigA [Cupriavidus sp. SHE]QBP11844.1 2,3-dihydroxybiphenyl 1,2-dioxygenase [Cupriavidus metallidurans]
MDIIGIGYLGFESTQLDEWRSYGPEVLGFQIGRSPEADAESLYFRIDDRRHRFAFHPGKVDRLAYIGWEARGKLEFEAAARRLREAGIEITMGDAALRELRGVRDVFRFRDPIGYQHELFYGQKWMPRSFIPGRPHGGFVAGERGLGHLVVITPEFPPELEHFLTEVMGFHYYGAGAGKGKTAFYRSRLNESTSHDIAYGHGPGKMGIQHVGLFVKTLRDVGETYDIVRQRKLPMMMTLGQHTQDPHVSFYHFSPGGFAIEVITELEPWHPDGFELNPEQLSTWGHELVGPILGPSVRAPEEVQDAEGLDVLAALARKRAAA